MWKLSEIVEAISVEIDEVENGLSLELWNPELKVGVGHNSLGEQILVLPGQENLQGFEKKYATFSPWVNAYWLQEGQTIEKVAILKCKFNVTEATQMRAVAGIFSGLLEINAQYGSAGPAIHSLKKLFEEGLVELQPSGVTGLIGELCVIAASPDISLAISTWHTNKDSVYDFSWDNFRTEVKSTRGTSRVHFFSSHQLPAPAGVDLQIASVLVATTEIGQTLGDLVNLVIKDQEEDTATKVVNQCFAQLGMSPYAVVEPIFDIVASLANIEYFDQQAIPTPTVTPGVLSMKWEASLEAASPKVPNRPGD